MPTIAIEDLVAQLPGIFVALSPDCNFRMLAVSDMHLDATQTTRPEVIGKPFFEVFTDNPECACEGREALKASLERILRTRRSETLPVLRYDLGRWPGRDDQRFWKATNTAVLDVQGDLAYILYHVVDVTPQILAETELRSTGGRYRQILDSARDHAIISTDLQGRIISWNKGAEAILGWTETEMRGHSADRFFTPEDVANGRPAQEMRIALDAGSAPDERWHVRKSGERFWASGEMTPLSDEAGQVQGFVKVLRDRTEAEQAKEALAKALVRLQELNATLEARVATQAADRERIWRLSPDLMGVCDANGNLLAVNAAWSVMLGWKEEVLLRTNFLDLMHPEDREATMAELLKPDAGHPIRFENRFRQKDGNYLHVAWVAAPYENNFYAIGRDVTLQRATEAQLRQSQKMEAMGQLTGGIAHDFNNLLAAITSSLELIKRKIHPPQLEGIDRYLSMATSSAGRAAALIQRLLAFSRKQSLDLQAVDVNQLVVGMEDLFHRTLGENVRLELNLEAGLPRARSDKNQLENALLNLCINARDAMPQGGSLWIRTSMVSLDRFYTARETDLKPGEYVRLCVTDTGVGMPPHVLAKAFDPFFTTKPIGQGTGLGLSMIYGFTKQTGGHASIHSVVGQGTTFNIYLPRATDAIALATAQSDKSAETVAPPQGHGESILFVEDEANVRSILKEVLHELGYVAHEAVDAPSALQHLATLEKLDLLITDVGLPGTNGRQLAESARVARPGLKVLFITGYASQAAVRGEFLDHGMDMLPKPFTIDALALKVKEMLAQRDE